jgi:hypothetical protein
MAFLFFGLVAFFTMQPLISSQQTASAMPCCSEMMKCHAGKDPSGKPPSGKHSTGDNSKCQGEGCNPFMACAFGNFYLVEKSGFDFSGIAPEKEKKIAIDDNRLSKGLSESWHPPERLSPITTAGSC